MRNKFLYETLKQYKALNRISFHTPGHKNVAGDLFSEMFTFDFTELPETDSLYEASGAILNSETAFAKVFGTKKTFFSAGGCTLCIQTMIRQTTKSKKKIIIGRTIHKSAINTIALLGLDPIFVMPKNDSGPFLPGRISPIDVKRLLEQNKDVAAVYVTSPDYFGVISDIGAIADVCKGFDVPLIVDNAHGTHLKFLSRDLHPITLGATMSADSAHKTLPVLTGGALLQVNNEKYIDGTKESMSLFGSTSPSYPIMASLDFCRIWLEEVGNDPFFCLENQVKEFLEFTKSLGFLSPEGVSDPTRISLCPSNFGITGTELSNVLRENGIEPEYANKNYVVLIPTPFTSTKSFALLKKVLMNLKPRTSEFAFKNNFFPRVPEKVMLPREAMLSDFESVSLSDSVNRICYETVSPCPPGIPVVMPGEVISCDVIDFLKDYEINFIKVIKRK